MPVSNTTNHLLKQINKQKINQNSTVSPLLNEHAHNTDVVIFPSPSGLAFFFSFHSSYTRMESNLANLQPADSGHSPWEAGEIGLKFLKLKRAPNIECCKCYTKAPVPSPAIFRNEKETKQKSFNL